MMRRFRVSHFLQPSQITRGTQTNDPTTSKDPPTTMGVVRQEAGRDVKSLIAPVGSFPVNGKGSTKDDAGRRDDASNMTSLRVKLLFFL